MIISLLMPCAWAETSEANDSVQVTTHQSADPPESDAEERLPQAEHVNLKEVLREPLAPTDRPEEAASSKAIAGRSATENLPEAEAVAKLELPSETEPQALSEVEPQTESDAPAAEDLVALEALPAYFSTGSGEVASEPSHKEPPDSAPTASRQQSLRLLGSEVPPGTATRLAWAADESFPGIAAPTPVLVVHGKQPGPTLCLTAAVHGDELNGIEVVRHILYDLDPSKLQGTVIGVPIVNLQGFQRGSRYLPDRRDLNRFFPGDPAGSAASRLAHSFFHQVVHHCDLLVDLHTGSFRRTNLPQLRADLKHPGASELAHHMGAIVVLHGTGAEGTLRRAAVEAGVPAVTLEAGEPHNVQQDAVNHSIRSIETLLYNRDMYPQRGFWARQTEPVYYRSRWIRAATGGVLISQVKLGERVRAGAVLGTITDPITNYRDDIVAPINGRVIGMALNQVMFPGFAAYHIGYQTSAEDAAEQESGNDEEDEGVLSGSPQSSSTPNDEPDEQSERSE